LGCVSPALNFKFSNFKFSISQNFIHVAHQIPDVAPAIQQVEHLVADRFAFRFTDLQRLTVEALPALKAAVEILRQVA